MRAVFVLLLVAIVVGAMALPVLEDDDDKPLVRVARTPQFGIGGLVFGGGLGYGGGYGGGYRRGYGGGYGRGYGRRYGGFGYGGGGYGSSSSEEDYG